MIRTHICTKLTLQTNSNDSFLFLFVSTLYTSVSDLPATFLNSTSCISESSSNLDAFSRLLGGFLTGNQTNQDALDRIKLGGVDERVGADVEE